MNTRVVNVADLAGKSDAELKKDLDKMKSEEKVSAADKQKELNRKTLESLAEASSTMEEDRESEKLANLEKEISSDDKEQEAEKSAEKQKSEKSAEAPKK